MGMETCTSGGSSVDYVELKGNVVFDGVDFGYNDDKIVLHDVKLYAEPGQKLRLSVPPERARRDYQYDQPLL